MTSSSPSTPDHAAPALSPELLDLAEKMAERVHETWMEARLSDGWVYGEQRNDELRTHPGLVPYDQRSEREKDYDRITSQETLRFILAAGFRITPPTPATEL